MKFICFGDSEKKWLFIFTQSTKIVTHLSIVTDMKNPLQLCPFVLPSIIKKYYYNS